MMIVVTGTLSLRTHGKNYHTTLLHSIGLRTRNNVQQESNLDNERFSLWIWTSLFRGNDRRLLEMSAPSKATVPKDGRTNCLWYSFAPASSIAVISASVSLGASNVLRYSTRRDSFVVVLERFFSR
jgi:hypothetical protein